MPKSWKKVTITEAQAHPLYGVKSWLIVFAVGLLLGVLRELGWLTIEAHKAGLSVTQLLAIDHPAIHLVKTTIWLNAGFVAVIYWALLTKNPHFRLIASSLMLLSWPISALISLATPFDGLGTALVMSLIQWIFSCALWVTYLNRSHRVRITFEQMVLDTVPDSSVRIEISNSSTGKRNLLADRSQTTKNHNTPTYSSNFSKLQIDASIDGVDFDEDLWAASLAEFESQNRHPGLWAKCFSEASGNEAAAKAEYLSRRTIQLRLDNQAAQIRQQQIELAEHELQVFRASLNEKRAELFDCVEFAKLNSTNTPIGILKKIVRLIGGKLYWTSTGIFTLGWRVNLNDDTYTFRDDSQLSKWILDSVLQMTETTFPIQTEAASLGSCPSCGARIPLKVVSCLGCQAIFGPGSTWRPKPLGED